MSIRNTNFVEGEYYHIYNRGVEKRDIFEDKQDLDRFIQSIEEFNTKEPIGSLYENSFVKDKLGGKASKLVSFVAYCLNPNHYHFIITPLIEGGIEKFMQKLGTGYTMYFNNRQKRSGVLFQGKFKSKYIDSNEYLLKLSSYVNFNNCDENGKVKNKLSVSSLEEYVRHSDLNFCDKSIILEQFRSRKEYKEFALESWKDACKNKKELADLEFS